MQDARANEVDSGTELEEDEIEEIGAVEEEKGEEEKKEDWEEEKETKRPQSFINDQWMYPPADQNVYTFRLESKSTCNVVKLIHQPGQ